MRHNQFQDDYKGNFFENCDATSEFASCNSLPDLSSRPSKKRNSPYVGDNEDTFHKIKTIPETNRDTSLELNKVMRTINKVAKRTAMNPNPLNRERTVLPGPSGNETKFQFDKRCLLKYLELHGDMIVPQFFLVPWTDSWPEDMWGARLGRLVDRIRQLHSHKDKKEELSSIGFMFSNQKKINFLGNWEIIKLALGKYKEFNGHLQIIQRFVVPSTVEWPEITWGLKLGNFVKYVQKRNAYAEHRSTLLEMGIKFKNKVVFDTMQCNSLVAVACDSQIPKTPNHADCAAAIAIYENNSTSKIIDIHAVANVSENGSSHTAVCREMEMDEMVESSVDILVEVDIAADNDLGDNCDIVSLCPAETLGTDLEMNLSYSSYAITVPDTQIYN